MLCGSPSHGVHIALDCIVMLAEDLHDLSKGALTMRESYVLVRRDFRIAPLSKLLKSYSACYKSKTQPTTTKYLANEIQSYFMQGDPNRTLIRIRRRRLEKILQHACIRKRRKQPKIGELCLDLIEEVRLIIRLYQTSPMVHAAIDIARSHDPTFEKLWSRAHVKLDTLEEAVRRANHGS